MEETVKISDEFKAEVTAGLPPSQRNFVVRWIDLLWEERKNWTLSQLQIGVPPVVIVLERRKRQQEKVP